MFTSSIKYQVLPTRRFKIVYIKKSVNWPPTETFQLIIYARPFLSSPYVYQQQQQRRFSVVRSAPFVAVGIGQWPRWDIVLSSPMARALPAASLDHPGRGLKHRRRPLTRHRRQRFTAALRLSAIAQRAQRDTAAAAACAPDHYGHLQQEGERVGERAATATLRVSSAECQPYPDQSTSAL